MEIFSRLSYDTGSAHIRAVPLARFLPPIPEGMAQAWLQENIPPYSMLLDPFGAAPALALEAARNGYRVLISVSNPISRFLIETLAKPPQEDDFKAALAELAASRKKDERLEIHIPAYYLTTCAQCGKRIQAQAFLWKRNASEPYARMYTCPFCKDSGERLVKSDDIDKAKELARIDMLHRSRAIERVAPLEDPDRDDVQLALSHYLPRAVYVLSMLINRLDQLTLSPIRKRALTAMLLSILDEGNTLWARAGERPRPRQLTTASEFRENNLWLALERSIQHWTTNPFEIPLSFWPELPPSSGGICIFDGPVRELAQVSKNIPINCIFTAIPRPNQAFWTLSSLWAGWLWGAEAAEPFKPALRRKRYDWQWHTHALWAAMRHASALVPAGTPAFTLAAEPEPGFVTAIVTAANAAQLEMTGIALRWQQDPLQVSWRKAIFSPESEPSKQTVSRYISQYLMARNEPVAYVFAHTAALGALCVSHQLPDDPSVTTRYQLTQKLFQGVFASASGLIRHGGSEQNLEAGLWDLEKRPPGTAFADQVEILTVQYLQRNPACSLIEASKNINLLLKGLLTPPLGLIHTVLDSYGTQQDGVWTLREEDFAAARRKDLAEMLSLLEETGTRLGFQTDMEDQPGAPLLWKSGQQLMQVIYVLASGVLGKLLATNPYPPDRCLLVIPGGRANLIDIKLRRNPSIQQEIGRGYRFVKYRHVRKIVASTLLTWQTWNEQLKADPIKSKNGQLMMF